MEVPSSWFSVSSAVRRGLVDAAVVAAARRLVLG
jgi:hypothetical protein